MRTVHRLNTREEPSIRPLAQVTFSELLKHVLQGKLNQPRVHRLAGDLPKGCVGDVQLGAGRSVELWMVEHVEELRAEHQARAPADAAHRSGLLDRRIEVKLAGAKDNPVPRISIPGGFSVGPDDRGARGEERSLVEVPQATGRPSESLRDSAR